MLNMVGGTEGAAVIVAVADGVSAPKVGGDMIVVDDDDVDKDIIDNFNDGSYCFTLNKKIFKNIVSNFEKKIINGIWNVMSTDQQKEESKMKVVSPIFSELL